MVRGGAPQLTAADVADYRERYDDTPTFPEDPHNSEFNVITWAWGSDLKTMLAQELINGSVNTMESLIAAYRPVSFVFQTSTLAWGWWESTSSNLRARNEEVRALLEPLAQIA